MDYVNAEPTKRFFVEMLIRDIRLEDAIVDLVDNAIDSLMRRKGIDLPALVTDVADPSLASEQSHFVNIKLDDAGFSIEDNCGGIELEDAKEHVFRFGLKTNYRTRGSVCMGLG